MFALMTGIVNCIPKTSLWSQSFCYDAGVSESANIEKP